MKLKQIEEFRLFLLKNNFSANTVRSYLTGLYTYLNIYKSLNAENIANYQIYLESHFKPRSINLRVIGFNKYLSFIGKNDYRLTSVKCHQASFLDDILSYEEYLEFKECLECEKDKRWYYIVWLLASTGVRISELVKFRAEDIFRGYMDVRSKGRKVRRVYVPKNLQESLCEWLEVNNLVSGCFLLNPKGQQLTIRGITKGLERAANRYDFDKHLVHPHAFRHLFAKMFLEKKGDLSMLADLLGHESLDTTKIYLRKTSREQQNIINDIVEW